MICKRCLLTKYHRNVSFDKRGICNFCISYDKNKKVLAAFPKLEQQFNERIEERRRNRANSNYDCIVPLSGGKDSSYILYKMKKEYNSKILAVTCENWFSNKMIREGAVKLCKSLGIDHIYYKPDWNIVKKFYSAIFKNTGFICLGCMAIIWLKIFKIAIKKNIPAIIIGESRNQMMSGGLYFDFGLIKNDYNNLVNFGKGFFVWKNYYKKQFLKINMLVKKYFPNDFEIEKIFKFPFGIISDSNIPDIIPYFFFKKHNEKKIIQELKKEIGWNSVKADELISHPDCWFHTFIANPFLDAYSLSVYAREGVISREEALRECLLKTHNFTKNDHSTQLEKILARLNLSVNDIENKRWYRYRKRHEHLFKSLG